MALDAYMRITGLTQGEIKGSVARAGREDSIMVVAVSHGLDADGDGLEHSPLTVTKELDRSTVPLARALATSELLTDVRLEFYRPSRSGAEVHYFTIDLINAGVSSIRKEMLNNTYPENMRFAVREHVSFTYETIVQTWEESGDLVQIPWT